MKSCSETGQHYFVMSPKQRKLSITPSSPHTELLKTSIVASFSQKLLWNNCSSNLTRSLPYGHENNIRIKSQKPLRFYYLCLTMHLFAGYPALAYRPPRPSRGGEWQGNDKPPFSTFFLKKRTMNIDDIRFIY